MSRDRFPPPALLLLAVTLLAACTAHTPTTDPPTRPFSRIGAVSHTALFPRIEAGQHTAPINRIGVDAAGRWLVTASHDKTARIWDLKSGALQRVLRPPIGAGNEGKLSAAALSPDGRLVAVGGWTEAGTGSDNIYLFDRATGALVRRIGGLPNVILYLDFSPDGTRLAAALWGGEGIRVYRTDSWAEIGRDADYGADSYWVDFDGRGRLVTSCWDGFIRLYDPKLRLIAKKKVPGGDRPFGVAFAPDSNRIAVGFHDSTAVNVLSGTDLSLRYSLDTSDMDNGNLGRVAWSRNGRTLFAAGRYRDHHNPSLVSWSKAGHGLAQIRPIATNTVMDLVSLADGRLVFGAGDPAWGLLDAAGKGIRGQGPTITDFRMPSDKLRLSDDGKVVEVDFDVLGANRKWEKHVLRLDLAQRRLELDPGRSQRRLAPPRIQASGLSITDWYDHTEPKLNGKPLELEPFETSRSLDIAEGGGRFLLGTAWSLRLYQRNGNLIWQVPAPSDAMMVKLSGDGRWAVVAFGDGSLRWFEVANRGRERLALFLDGAAIGARKRGGKAATVPWVLWTPEGFFHSAGGGERLMGWHRNRGADQAGELLNAGQIGEVFRRPDLVAQALDPSYPELAQAALQESGGLERLLADTQAPRLERLGPARVRVTGPDFTARFRLQDGGSGVGRIEYRVDGALVGQGNKRGYFGPGLPNRHEESWPFTLGPGRHRVEARAFDPSGRLASPWLVWEVQATGAARRQPDLYGLAVGIGPYQDQALSLEYGDDDAAAFAAALKAAGRGLFRAVDVRPLVNQQATLAGITQAFGSVAAKAGPEDVFVLFLAGHGLVQDGRYHFIPWDLRYTNRKALRTGSLHEDRLRDLLARVQARKSLIVIDSCHAGALLGDGLRLAALYRGGPALEHRAAIDRLMAKTGRAMLASTTERKFALEGLDGHGVFTHVLLEGLRGRADLLGNRNRTIETSELADYLEEEVPRVSHRVWRYEQHPMRDLQGQSFPIGLRRRSSEP